MTEQEALEIINNMNWEYYDDCYCLMKPARNMAIKSLEKQIAKKPIPGGLYSCPNCEKLLGYGAFEPKGLYCKHCGQKLDWSDEYAVD